MKTKPARIVLVAVVALLQAATDIAQTGRGNQALNPPYLREMPAVERVKAELKGTNAMDTAARHMGAFWQLQQIIKELSGFRWTRNQLTQDEKRLLGQYGGGYQTAAQPYAHIQNAPSHPDKPRWYQMHAFYETDDGFREELFTRFLSPTLRAEYAKVKGETRATVRARQEAREKAWKEEQARAQAQAQAGAPGGAQPYKREEQAARAMLEGLVKATTELVNTLGSQVQTAQPGTAEGYYELGNKYLKAKQCDEAIEALKKAISLKPSSAAYNDLGRAYFCRIDYSEAEAAFKEALRLKPDNETALLNLGFAYSSQTKIDEAQKVYLALKIKDPARAKELYTDIQEAKRAKEEIEKAKKQLGESRKAQPGTAGQSSAPVTQPSGRAGAGADADKAQGDRFWDAKDYTRAIDSYKRAIALNPSHASAYYRLALGYHETKQWDASISTWNKYQTLEKMDPSALILLGNAHRELKHFDDALGVYRSIIRQQPEPKYVANAHDWIGRTYNAMGQYESAVSAFQEALRIEPNDGNTFRELGNSYYGLKQYPKAVAALQQAIRLKPNNAQAQFNLGFVYIEIGNKDEAQKVYRTLQTIDKTKAEQLLAEINKPNMAASPDVTGVKTAKPSTPATSAEAYLAQGDQSFKANDYAKAIEVYKRAIALKPDSETLAAAHFRIGRTYHELRQDQDAVPALQEAVRIKPDSARANLQLGFSYLNLHQYPNALAAFQQAVRLKPDDAEGHFWVGVVYNDLKQPDKAVLAFQEALRLRPDDRSYRNTLYHLGETYYKLKQYPNALATFKQYLSLKPNHSGALYNLGMTYVGMGKKDNALKVYRTLLTIDEQKAQWLYTEINKSN